MEVNKNHITGGTGVSRIKKQQKNHKIKRRKKEMLTLLIALSLGVSVYMPEARADGGQLTDGSLGTSKNAFADKNITSADEVSATANMIQINSNATNTKINYNGTLYGIQGNETFFVKKALPSLLTAINTETGKDYNAIIFIVPDGSKRVAYATNGTLTIGKTLSVTLITSTFFNDLTDSIGTSDLMTADKQLELYNILKSGDTSALQAFLSKYLPMFYAAKIDDLSKISDVPTAGAWSPDTLAVSNDNISELSTTALSSQNWYLSVYNGKALNSTESGTTSTYNAVNIPGGSNWRPMDRVIYTQAQTGLFNDTVNIAQYWSIDSGGNITSNSSGQTGTVTWSNSGMTVDKASTNSLGDRYTAITVGNLTTGRNAVIDMTYANTAGGYNSLVYSAYANGFYLDENGNPTDEAHGYSINPNRIMYVDSASLGEGTTFRLGNYIMDASLQHNSFIEGNSEVNYDIGYVTPNDYNSAMKFSGGHTDSVYITNAAPAGGGKTDLYIELGWVPGVGILPAGDVVLNSDIYSEKGGNVPVLLGILHGSQYFNVLARKSLADGVFSTYEITPYITEADNYFTDPDNPLNKLGTAWYLSGYSFADTGELSNTGKAASDNSLLTGNLWRENYLNMFRRADDLHARYKKDVPDGHENTWGQVWHGRFSGDGAYGRSMSQNYNGVQGGYDKLLNKKFYNGKVYTGFFLSKVTGSSGTFEGSGDQDSMGLGIYGSWVGDRGHFLDLGITADRFSNDYNLYANLGDGTGASGRVTGSYGTWGYGLGLQYGRRSELAGGWWYEPAAALFLGTVDDTHYKLSNHLGIDQQSYDNVTGRLRLRMGRDIGTRGDIYGSAGLMHEFSGDQNIEAFYGYQHRPIAAAGGSDTWLELKLGGNYRISPSGKLNLEFARTAGQGAGSNWSINGRLDFAWDGFGAPNRKKATNKAGSTPAGSEAPPAEKSAAYSQAHTPTVVIGAPGKDSAAAPQADTGKALKPAAAQNENGPEHNGRTPQPINTQSESAPVGKTAPVPDSADTAAAAPVSAPDNTAGGDLPSFDLGSITVEAKRPEWENELSPGQVSVVYTDKYKGEQKDLPALLQSVPGLYVQKVSGTGHYTVARVRGATGAQVNVYVDGVPMNLNGESAVNLSAIPVDNVERIEVYRGYVPARFAGAPIGGVINIVTKKPDRLRGSITQGVKSYGGYTGTYQLTAPLGNGSLLATYQRDIWQGDYDFHAINPNPRVMSNYGPYWFDGNIKRRSNGYQNDNGMLKWQDKHWLAKIAWKDLHEELPTNVSKPMAANVTADSFYGPSGYEGGYWDSRLDTQQKEFLIGRRDTAGRLDFGWQLSYLDNKKDYLNTGYYKRWQTLADAGVANPAASSSMQDITSPGGLWAHYHSKKWNLAMDTAYKLGDNHLLELHGDVSRETMDADVSGRETYWSMLEDLGLQYIHQYRIDEDHFNIQDTITLNEAGDFKLTPVIRLDRVDMQTMSSADRSWKYSGGAALQKQLNDHWSLKTTWGTYNRHPNFYELFGDGATIAPNAGAGEFFGSKGGDTWEHGTQFDFSLNWQGKMARADTDTVLTWFQRRAENQFALWTPMLPNTHSTYFPMDEARVHGVELTHNMKWHRTTLNLAATWQKADYSDETALSSVGNTLSYKSTISYTPEWVLNARLDYLWPGDKLNTFVEYNFLDRQFIGNSTTDARDRYWMSSLSTVDLGAKYRFSKDWILSAGVNDLFDRGKDVFDIQYGADGSITMNTPAYPLPGRTYYMTLEYKF